jgi:hypothetical protein
VILALIFQIPVQHSILTPLRIDHMGHISMLRTEPWSFFNAENWPCQQLIRKSLKNYQSLNFYQIRVIFYLNVYMKWRNRISQRRHKYVFTRITWPNLGPWATSTDNLYVWEGTKFMISNRWAYVVEVRHAHRDLHWWSVFSYKVFCFIIMVILLTNIFNCWKSIYS